MQINPDDSLFAITEAWPETISAFADRGFPQMADAEQRAAFGKQISLRQALTMKAIDLDAYLEHLHAVIAQADGGNQHAAVATARGKLQVTGLLPCPVRIPLLESFDKFAAGFEADSGLELAYELQAASMGASWIADNLADLESAEQLPDLFISAGFETFFDPQGLGRFRDTTFVDAVRYTEFNASFDGIDLRDPNGRYSVISVVPAIFMVNYNELGDAPAPRSWAELLEPRFANRVSLPVGDFDLFSSILLDIHQRFGDEGVTKLGRSLSESMHPAQMVKTARKPKSPIVTIMPYFFTKMTLPGSPMQVVWPEDGAIISPIFMLAKRSRREELQPVIDFFASKETGELLAHKGLFPSTHPEVDNRLDADRTFNWLGWDYIGSQDIAALISHCQTLFAEGEGS